MTWHEQAICLTRDPELWMTPNNNQTTQANDYAVAICKRCPVQTACLTEALEVERGTVAARYHIYGGLTPMERAKLDDGPRKKQRRVRAA